MATGSEKDASRTFKNPRPLVYLSRRQTFSAAHRLHSQKLTDEDNKRVFGKCNNANGHGHNYAVEVVVKAPVDEDVTGMAMNLADLKRLIAEEIEAKLDHKNLDLDVDYFKRLPSTTENLAVFIWRALESRIADVEAEAKLHEVKLYETEKNLVIYRGESY